MKNQKSKKTRIITTVILLIIAIRGFMAFQIYKRLDMVLKSDPSISDEFKKNNNKRWFSSKNNKNFKPEFCKNIFLIEDENKSINKVVNELYRYDNKDMDMNSLNKFENVLKQSKIDLNNISLSGIRTKIGMKKRNMPFPLEESALFPTIPSYKYSRVTARYWYFLSRLFEKNNDDEKALILSLGIYYLAKDLETNYSYSCTLTTKMVCVALNNIANNSIIYFASRPRKINSAITKDVAKDILDFVKNDYPLSTTFENEFVCIKEIFYAIAKTVGYGLNSFVSIAYFNRKINEYYDEFIKDIDNPNYDTSSKIKEFENKLFNNSNKTFKRAFYFVILPEFLAVDDLIQMSFPNFKSSKDTYILCLAKMEMSAIALLINSFYSEKNRLPASIDELNKWFGSELPKNRLTNEPYKFFNDNHMLHITFSSETYRKEDFYFDFIK